MTIWAPTAEILTRELEQFVSVARVRRFEFVNSFPKCRFTTVKFNQSIPVEGRESPDPTISHGLTSYLTPGRPQNRQCQFGGVVND